jgi:HlyD family secretion protein
MKKKKWLISATILVAVVVIVVGATILKKDRSKETHYRTEAIGRGDIEALVVTSGTLNPVTTVEVGSQVSGKIDKINVDYNSQVKKGDVLAELDLSILQSKIDQNNANYVSAQAALDGAKVTLDNLKKKYDRALSLFEKNLISYEEKEAAEAAYLGSKADLTSAQARVQQAKSLLESSKLDLGYAIIRSPIDGIVITRDMNVGQTVQASYQAPKLFTIANDLSKMQVECSVDEADVGKVSEGQKVRFTVDAFPDETFSGTVKQVRYSPTTSQNVVTYSTIVDVDNPGMKLRPGMTATVSIITGEARNVLRVPNSALRFTPTLPAEELAKIMKASFEAMMAKRQAEAGQTGQAGSGQPGQPGQLTGSGAGQAQAGAANRRPDGQGDRPRSGGMMLFQGQSLGSGGGAGQGMRSGGRQPSRVWVQDKDGKLRMVFLRTGVTDNSYTEIVRSELKEGDLVILGENGATSSSQGGQRMMFFPR